jgi:hypothetical protein
LFFFIQSKHDQAAMPELITVIVASYNYENFLPQTLDSLIAQTYQEWEAIVVDDGSRDSSVSIIVDYARRDRRIRLIQHPGGINRGLSATIQLAMSCAEGTWIAFCESDDWWNPLFLEAALKRSHDDPVAGLVFSDVILEGKSPAMETHCETVRMHFRNGGDATELYRKLCNAVPSFSCAMVKRDLLRSCDFDAHFAPSLDMWLWAQLVNKTRFSFIDEPLVHWRQHDTSYMKKSVDPASLEMEAVPEFHRRMKNLFDQGEEPRLSRESSCPGEMMSNKTPMMGHVFGKEPESDLPRSFDVEYYRKSNPDLVGFSDFQLGEHYELHGQSEGRPGAAFALREQLIRKIAEESSILEIGPFCNPLLTGCNVRYFDVLDQSELKNRASACGYPHQSAPHIDFVSPSGDLSIVTEIFSAVTSSHCLEHQPDLIRHLQRVGSILHPNGRYYLIIPDKRYCFDHFLPCSMVSDIIEAYMDERKVHSASSVIEHCALITHNDCARHWQGDHSDSGNDSHVSKRIRDAMNLFENSSGKYIDVHAWQFTPLSFHKIIKLLFELGLIPLSVERVYNTPNGRNEFVAILRNTPL